MAKPLFRFTIGPCSQQGLDILAESMRKSTQALGSKDWDWAVCYNGLKKSDLDYLQESARNLSIKFILQNWGTCPIEDDPRTPYRKNGNFECNGRRCGGSLWKVCPPRLRMGSHELVVDNDIILLKKFPQIEKWLESDKALILEEPVRFYGKYDFLFKNESEFLNSGFMGLPPGYDFGQEIRKVWETNGKYTMLSQADEQGLLMAALNQHPNIRVKKDQMIEMLYTNRKTKISFDDYAYHFTQANRTKEHLAWKRYQALISTDLI